MAFFRLIRGLFMSYSIGTDILNLRPAPRPGHVVYSLHDPLRERVRADTGLSLEDAWECDLIWHTNDGPNPWGALGRVTDMGHAEFIAGGLDRRDPVPCPFRSLDEARAFDAVREYGLQDTDTLTGFYEGVFRDGQRQYPNQLFTGGYYKTLISGAIEIFGWDMLLQLAADQDAFETVLDTIFQVSLHHYRAWANTGIEAFICHDDMVWTQGPFMDPAFYRRVLFPRYKALFKILHDAGKKVLYCSDGTWTAFVDDIADAGADGFIFEPTMPLESIAARYGRSHVLIGSAIDCRTLTFGSREQIRAEVDATLRVARDCPGFFIAVGNHIPSNVPLENALFYFACLREGWQRQSA